MKTSELISELQKIEKTVPFDAEIVIGDDWQFGKLKKVSHDAPRTYLEFEEIPCEEPEPDTTYDRIIELVPTLLKQHKDGELTTDEASNKVKGILRGWC